MSFLVHEESYRGKSLIDKINDRAITVCGCGAIGSNLIFNMIKQGFRNITVIDKDRIEKHNIGTQIWGLREVNGKKAQIMRNKIFDLTGLVIMPIENELTLANVSKLLNTKAIIIDSFDNFPSRQIITDYCKLKNIDCLHIGLAEGYAEIIWNERYKIPSVKNTGVDVCDYPLSRNIAMLATIVGIETIIKYIDSGIKICRSITLDDLKIDVIEE